MATEEDKVNSGALATLVAVSTFAMLGVTLAVTALTRDELGIAQSEREDRGSNEARELQRQQAAKLQAGLPIEEAMKRVVQRLAQDPSSATRPGPPVMVPGTAGAGGATGAGAGPSAGAGGNAGGAAAAGAAGAPAAAGSPGTAPQKNLGKSAGAAGQMAPGSVKPPGAPALSANPAKAPTPAAVPAPPEPGSAPSPGN